MNDKPRIVEGFIDANILADGILVHNRIDELTAHFKADGDINRVSQELSEHAALFESYQPAKLAHALFNVLKAKNHSVFMTSNFAFLEAGSVMMKLYKERLLAKQGIPHSEWQINKIKLSRKEQSEISAGISKFKARYGKQIIISDEYDYSMADVLVLKYGCRAPDAILVCSALKASCERFVTRDERLKRQLRGFKEIKITLSEVFLKELGFDDWPSFMQKRQ